MIYFRDKGKKVKEMSAGIVVFVTELENRLREQINQVLLEEQVQQGIVGEEYERLLPAIKRDSIRIAEDIRVQAFDLARKMVIEGV
ncbi:MAG TPA: hypothetical protein VHO84_12360 [Syntrophorhabdaceae bacterium]|jgi:hypothetical protein|nr:hypothetical protein [Syntrophorhabdaceae bacterium]